MSRTSQGRDPQGIPPKKVRKQTKPPNVHEERVREPVIRTQFDKAKFIGEANKNVSDDDLKTNKEATVMAVEIRQKRPKSAGRVALSVRRLSPCRHTKCQDFDSNVSYRCNGHLI